MSKNANGNNPFKIVAVALVAIALSATVPLWDKAVTRSVTIG